MATYTVCPDARRMSSLRTLLSSSFASCRAMTYCSGQNVVELLRDFETTTRGFSEDLVNVVSEIVCVSGYKDAVRRRKSSMVSRK